MPSPPMRSGAIDAEGVVPILAEVEALRVSGVLRFTGARKGEVALVAGQVSAEQDERDDGEDVIDVLLAERDGRYEVFQKLPPLPVSGGDESHRHGSLTVHVPADLMNYCERAGLTGVLTLNAGERCAEIAYAAGELDAIRLEGAEELHEAFAWDEGTFTVHAENSAPNFDTLAADESMDETRPFVRAPRPIGDSTGKHFLRVVEFTLSDILREREERRPASRTGPPLPPEPPKKAHASLPPPKKRDPRDDQTVRVIYLAGSKPTKKKETPMASEAAPETTSSAPALSDEGLPTWVWALAVVVTAIVALLLLSALPPVR